MRLTPFLVSGLVLTGCVPTADFVALRNENLVVKSENKKLKETEGELRRRLEEHERALSSTVAAARLDTPETKQQGLDERLEEKMRQLEEASRRIEALTGRLEEAEAKTQPKDEGRDVAISPPVVQPPKSGGLDSTAMLTPTAAYNHAYNDYLKGNYDLAVAGFETFLHQFPRSSLSAHAQYWIGEAHYNKGDYRSAVTAYERLINNHDQLRKAGATDLPHSEKLAAALYKAGSAQAGLGDVAKARSYLKRVIEDHPQSNEADLAKERLANLR